MDKNICKNNGQKLLMKRNNYHSKYVIKYA